MYVCGVTVYDLCHIGHARTFVNFDVIVRYLRYSGYEVKYVRNITDIDDKIIKRANERGIAAKDLAEQFIVEMHNDSVVDVKKRVKSIAAAFGGYQADIHGSGK